VKSIAALMRRSYFYELVCITMRLATITLAIALGLGTVSMTTAGMAFGNHGGLGGQFVHRGFGHHAFHNRFRFHKKFVIPYAYSDYDYGYPTDAFGDYPPPIVVAPPSSPSACQRSKETFTVPSEGGGTREITIINCP
jgi:hypothetical protein